MNKLTKIWNVMTGKDEQKTAELLKRSELDWLINYTKNERETKANNRQKNYYFIEKILLKDGEILEDYYSGRAIRYKDRIYLTNGVFLTYTGDPKKETSEVGKIFIQSHDSSYPEIYVDYADAEPLVDFLNKYVKIFKKDSK